MFHRNPAEIDLVTMDSADPQQTWYVHECGGGVVEGAASERTFSDAGSTPDDDLEFVLRGERGSRLLTPAWARSS